MSEMRDMKKPKRTLCAAAVACAGGGNANGADLQIGRPRCEGMAKTATSRRGSATAPLSSSSSRSWDVLSPACAAATFRVSADGKEVKTFTLEPKQGDPSWTNVSHVARWNVAGGRYLGSETFVLTHPAKELRIEMTEGDWAVVTELVFTSPEGKASLGFDTSWRDPRNFAQRFLGWKDAERFAAASGRTPRRYADPGREFMYRSQLRMWDEAVASGTWVMVGEFGVSSCTSQSTVMAFLGDQISLWNERDLGWAVWGGMGFLDCQRPGADEETLDGYLFNRKMYDLCK